MKLAGRVIHAVFFAERTNF